MLPHNPKKELDIPFVAKLRVEMGQFDQTKTPEEQNAIKKQINYFKQNPNELGAFLKEHPELPQIPETRFSNSRIPMVNHDARLVPNQAANMTSVSSKGTLAHLPLSLRAAMTVRSFLPPDSIQDRKDAKHEKYYGTERDMSLVDRLHRSATPKNSKMRAKYGPKDARPKPYGGTRRKVRKGQKSRRYV